MNLEGKRVLVVGSGKSGVAAAELLRKKGITFVLFDGNKDLDVTALIEKNPVFAGAEILLTIQEGKFHQVKRMFEALGCHVVFLKRLSMGRLKLDPDLKPGEYRALTEGELELLQK